MRNLDLFVKQLLRWVGILCLGICYASPIMAAPPEKVKGLYLTPLSCGERKVTETIHYIEQAKMNAVVLHAKDPRGLIYWQSSNPIARQIGAVYYKQPVFERAVQRFKDKKIYIIAKIDVFFDSLLAEKYPGVAVLDSVTGRLWEDRKKMHWVNPYDKRVWNYIIDLAKELAGIGVDEIQFDYTRFPSDGKMSRIKYPITIDKITKPCCIGEFLKTAYSELKPLGVNLSVDVFGLTVWEKEDFGVGQVLEAIAPHVDAVCPMLYPSHFPNNYLGWKVPKEYPYEIMRLSVKNGKTRTDKEIRPWVQGFWYTPEEINAQISGLSTAGAVSWSIWNPSSNYSKTYEALAKTLNTTFSEPSYYPSLSELEINHERIIKGNSRIVNYTNYKEGYSILSLDVFKKGYKNVYATILDVVNTLDEAIVDQILVQRNQKIKSHVYPTEKKVQLVNLLSKDLAVIPRRIPAGPIYIDWRNTCHFSTSVPKDKLPAVEIGEPSSLPRQVSIR